MESQKDSPFSADGHRAILNKMSNNKQKMDKYWQLEPQQKHRIR